MSEESDHPAVEEPMSSDFSDEDVTSKKRKTKSESKKGKDSVKKAKTKKSDVKADVKTKNEKKTAAKTDSKKDAGIKAVTNKVVASSKTGNTNVKVAVVTESDAKMMILNYLNEQNRPFSVIQLFENLHQAISKAKLQQLLDKLVENDELQNKSFGKAILYFAKQTDATISPEELNSLDSQIGDLSENLNECKVDIKNTMSELSMLESSISTENAKVAILSMETNLPIRKEKLQLLVNIANGNAAVAVTSEELLEIYQKYNVALKEWKKRKSACLDLVATATEEIRKSDLKIWMEENGLETDEEHKSDFSFYSKYFLAEVQPHMTKLLSTIKNKSK